MGSSNQSTYRLYILYFEKVKYHRFLQFTSLQKDAQQITV